MTAYSIRTDDHQMDNFEAESLADALQQFGAPADVRDARDFELWLNRMGGFGTIEADGERIARA